MRSHVALLVLVLTTSLTGADQPVEAVTPRWVPSGAQASEQQLTDLAKYLSPVIDELNATTRPRPAFGLLITHVRPGSPAVAAGLVPGDVITHLDGAALPDTSSLNRRRNGKTQTITVWTAKDGERKFEIKPGMLGVSQEESWNPAHGYLASRDAGAAWDADLIQACVMIEFDARVVELALMHAQEHGCTHPTWLALAARIALQTGRLTDATIFARAALERIAANERLPVAKLLYLSLIARGLIFEAQAVTRDYDVLSYEVDHALMQRRLDASVAVFRDQRAAHPLLSLEELVRPRPDEADLGRQMTYLSGPQQLVAEELARLDPEGDLVFQGKERCERLNGDGRLPFASHRDRLDLTRLGPVMRDLDCIVTCGVQDRGGPKIRTSMGAYAIGIADHQRADATILLRLRITEDARIQVRVADLPEYEFRHHPFGIYREHRLRVCIREHTMGVFVDDMAVYHGPLLEDPATRQLGLDLYTRDLTGEWSALTWRGVLSSQDLPVSPANTDRPKPAHIGADNFF